MTTTTEAGAALAADHALARDLAAEAGQLLLRLRAGWTGHAAANCETEGDLDPTSCSWRGCASTARPTGS